MTGIQWTDRTWNPATGCTKISAGCKNCYAKTLHDQRHAANLRWAERFQQDYCGPSTPVEALDYGREYASERGEPLPPMPECYDTPFEEVRIHEDRLREPLSWRKPQRVFVGSMNDLFHEDVPDSFLDQVFAVMALTPHITYQLLTKRPKRMAEYLNGPAPDRLWTSGHWRWPFPNVWLGTSVENQEMANKRIPELLRCPAAVRFVSFEPLLEAVNAVRWLQPSCSRCKRATGPNRNGIPKHGICECEFKGTDIQVERSVARSTRPGVAWVIIGGESGPNARPTNIAWIGDLRAQCQAAGVPTFVKQMGSKPWAPVPEGVGLAASELPIRLRHPHGGNPEEWDEDDRVREFPR